MRTGDTPRDHGAGMRGSGNPVRPLLLIDRLARAGTERQVLRLAAAMEERGEDPLLVTFEPPPAPDLVPACRHEIVPFRSFRSPSLLARVGELRGLVRRTGRRVVHAFFADSTILAWLATRGTGTPLVASVRQVRYQRWRAKDFLLRAAYRGCRRVLVNARAVGEALRADHPLDPSSIEVIVNGVVIPDPPPAPDPRVVELRGHGPVVGIVANLNRPVKRVDLFLRAAARVAGELSGARFVVVGEGELAPSLQELAGSLGIADRVLFTGGVPDPSPLVAGFDVAALSSDLEGLPNALLEAMALGVPQVATATGGIPELVVPGETGLLVPPGEAEAFAAALLDLLADPERRRRMGEASRRRARERFSLEAAVSAHLEAYRRAAGEAAGGGDR